MLTHYTAIKTRTPTTYRVNALLDSTPVSLLPSSTMYFCILSALSTLLGDGCVSMFAVFLLQRGYKSGLLIGHCAPATFVLHAGRHRD